MVQYMIVSRMSDQTLALGRQYQQAGQNVLAEQVYRQFLQANPEHVQGWRLLGAVCLAQGKFAEAMANYQQALRLQINDADTHNDLGVALAKQGNLVQAVVAFGEAVRLQPNHTNARNNLETVQRHLINRNAEVAIDFQRRMTELLDNMNYRQIMSTKRYSDPKRLLKYGYQVYSHGYGDGMINEIFLRIGTTNKKFIEFGFEPRENNTLFLLMCGWGGLWLDARAFDLQPFAPYYTKGMLKYAQAYLTMENINDVIREHHEVRELDLLVIDVDGNDYWLWEALDVVEPRVVVIEYNSFFPPPCSVAIKYAPNHGRPPILNYSGASLKALEKLGTKKGYRLVGCDFLGIDAFFVREDLVGGNLFCEPYTSGNHYEPLRCLGQKMLPLAKPLSGDFEEV